MDTVDPFIAATTGCATALDPASIPWKPPEAVPAPPPGRAGVGDAQTSSKSLPVEVGFDSGDWSRFWVNSAVVGVAVSWQQYSPKNQ